MTDVAYWQQRVRELTRLRDQAVAERDRLDRQHEELDDLIGDLQRLGRGADAAVTRVRTTTRGWSWQGPYSELMQATTARHTRVVKAAVRKVAAACRQVQADRRHAEDQLASVAVRIRSIEYELALARRNSLA